MQNYKLIQPGKICPDCGEWKPRTEFGRRTDRPNGIKSKCKLCEKIYGDNYRKNNPEKCREWGRKNDKKRAEKKAVYMKSYREKNKEAISETRAAYNANNPDRVKEWKRNYYKRNRDSVLERVAEYAKNNREKTKSVIQAYHSRKKGLEGRWSGEEWLDLVSHYGSKCLCCGSDDKLAADHIIPVSKIGSSNFIENIQPLCKSCNSRKSAKVIDFRPEFSCLLPGIEKILEVNKGD